MTIVLEIKVKPNAGKQLIKRDKSGKIVCSIKSSPEKGKANQELIKFISQKLAIPQDNVKILRGTTSPNKTLQITIDKVLDSVLRELGIEEQLSIL